MFLTGSRYGVFFGSAVHTGILAYASSGGAMYPPAAVSHGANCSCSIMKRRYSLAACGYLVYFMIIWLKNRCDSVGVPTGPTGNDACWMSAVISLTSGSCEFFAA